MRRTLLALAAIAVLGTALTPTADAQSQSVKSDNMTLAGNWHLPDGDYQGSDLAFWGDRMVSGMYSGPGGFGLLDISNPGGRRSRASSTARAPRPTSRSGRTS